jgi:hypothetical protein
MGRRGGCPKQFILTRIVEEDRGHGSPCWIWQMCLDYRGYAKTSIPTFPQKNTRVHRASYQLWVGSIPEGLTIDHLCRVRSCCNPAHLEAVTAAENSRRAMRSERTHCIRGHERSPENLTPQRECRICRNAYMRTWSRAHPKERAKANEYQRAWRAKRKQAQS